MRIVAGEFRGRKLADSNHLKDLRPTTDHNRETLFNILNSGKFIKEIGFEISESKVLDVCCGSGAVAFEALSRGANSVVLIEKNSAHLEIAKENSKIFKVEDKTQALLLDAKSLPQNKDFFDLVFIDPPYDEDYEVILNNLVEKEWIKKGSLVVIEFKKTNEPNFSNKNLQLLDLRRYGKSCFAFLQCLR